MGTSPMAAKAGHATDFEFDLATMAIKGKRFEEAAERFTALAGKTYSMEAWCGLGYAKLGMVLDGITAEEVFYCFDKAKAYGPGKAAEVEAVAIQATSNVVRGLYRLFGDATLAGRKASMQKIGAAIMTGVTAAAAMDHGAKDKPMASLMMAGMSAYNFDKYGKLAAKAEDCKALASTALARAGELRDAIELFIKEDRLGLVALNVQLDALLAETEEAILPEKEKQALIEAEKKKIYIEQKSVELLDRNHEFYQLKEKALAQFGKGKSADTLAAIKDAMAEYSEDEELIAAKKATGNAIMWRDVAKIGIPIGILALWLDIRGVEVDEGAPVIIVIIALIAIAVRHSNRMK